MKDNIITRWLKPESSSVESISECDECKHVLNGSKDHAQGCTCMKSTSRKVFPGNGEKTNRGWLMSEIARMQKNGDSTVRMITDDITGMIAIAR